MFLALLLAALAFAALIWWQQDRLIFFPRRYAPAERARATSSGLTEVEFITSRGRQVAFYAPPQDAAAPRELWVCFGGNGMAALDWLDHPPFPKLAPGAARLLVDYPGYGASEGWPSRAAIAESLPRLLPAVAARLGEPEERLAERLNVLGVSLGSAVALEFAVGEPRVRRLMLLAPFTSLRAMARRQVGWPLCEVLAHRWDNVAALKTIFARSPRPDVAIFHGTDDAIISVEMGRALAGAWPGWVRYQDVPGAGHNDIIDRLCFQGRRPIEPPE